MKRTIIAAFIFAIGIVGPVAYFLSDRRLPYEYLFGEVLPPMPAVGGQISIHWRVKINRYCPGWVQRTIIDEHGYRWYNIGGPVKNIMPVKRGDEADVVNTLELPRMLSAGPATYLAHVTYHCNWLQRWFWPITVDTPALQFTIKADR